MSTGAIIAIVVGAIILVALLAYTAAAMRRHRLEGRREEARGLHRQAQARSIQVEGQRASAEEHAARSRRAQAEAEEKAAQARRDELVAQERAVEADRGAEAAREHHDRARAVDPDMSDEGHEEAVELDGSTPAADTPRR